MMHYSMIFLWIFHKYLHNQIILDSIDVFWVFMINAVLKNVRLIVLLVQRDIRFELDLLFCFFFSLAEGIVNYSRNLLASPNVFFALRFSRFYYHLWLIFTLAHCRLKYDIIDWYNVLLFDICYCLWSAPLTSQDFMIFIQQSNRLRLQRGTIVMWISLLGIHPNSSLLSFRIVFFSKHASLLFFSLQFHLHFDFQRNLWTIIEVTFKEYVTL